MSTSLTSYPTKLSNADAAPSGGQSTTTPAACNDATSVNVAALASASLKSRVIQGLAWVGSGAMTQQLLRLASVTVLSRLLEERHYGLMIMVNVVIQGAQLMSDVGVRGSMIHHQHGDRQTFINTAWTIQVIRGLILWAAVSVAAWPVASFYNEPILLQLIPVVGLGAVLQGLTSTSRLTLSRHVRFGKQTIFDVGGQIIAVGVMIGLAMQWRSVWVLVIGGLVNLLIQCISSYFLAPGYRVRFGWDRASALLMFHFGKWVFVSTLLQFILQHADKAILGALITTRELGVFAMAIMIAEAMLQVLQRVSSELLFPVYARLSQKHDRLAFRHRMIRLRGLLLLLGLPPLWITAIWGQPIIDLVFDPRYSLGGPVLQVLAVGAIGAVITLTMDRITLAHGDSKRQAMMQVGRTVIMIGSIATGVMMWGSFGLFIGQAFARWAAYPLVVWSIRKYDGWTPGLDAAATAMSIAALATGFWWTGQLN